MSTIFSKIIAGEVPSHKVYGDEETFAFLDANPVNPGHTLVVPKKEYKNIYDIPDHVLCSVMQTVKYLTPIIKDAVGADGINLGQNNGPAAGQEVDHFHMHIMPRFKGDDFSHWHGAENYHSNGGGKKVAQEIRNKLEEVDKST